MLNVSPIGRAWLYSRLPPRMNLRDCQLKLSESATIASANVQIAATVLLSLTFVYNSAIWHLEMPTMCITVPSYVYLIHV